MNPFYTYVRESGETVDFTRTHDGVAVTIDGDESRVIPVRQDANVERRSMDVAIAYEVSDRESYQKVIASNGY
jgi:hypothetical protein